jgi:hypothetical protein
MCVAVEREGSMFRSGVVALLGLLLSVSLGFADPAGTYDIEGSNPGGGGTYRGTVEVTQTGETYRITWTIGSQIYTGTAIGNDDVLSIVYASADSAQTGLGVYSREQGGDWAGVWTPTDGTTLGKERWHRQ